MLRLNWTYHTGILSGCKAHNNDRTLDIYNGLWPEQMSTHTTQAQVRKQNVIASATANKSGDSGP